MPRTHRRSPAGPFPVLPLALLLLSATPALPGVWFDHTVTESSGRLQGLSLADHGDDITVAAWQDDQGQVFTRALVAGMWRPPVQHGAGAHPAVHVHEETIWLAWESGAFLQIQRGSLAGEWSGVTLLTGGTGYATARPDFGSDPGGPLHLAWEEGSRVLYARHEGGAWSNPEVVCIDGNTTFGTCAQVEPVIVAGTPRARVYYLRCPYPGEHQLHYRQHDGTSWSAPVMVAGGTIAEQYRVARYPDGRHAAFGIGLTGGCPCNHIYYTEETGSGWTFVQELTIDWEELNKPCYCGLVADPAGTMHAFWQQEFRQAGGPPLYTALFWKSRTAGVWSEAPAGFFGGRTGTWTALACPLLPAAAPCFGWVEETASGGSRIILKRTLAPEGLPDPGQPDEASLFENGARPHLTLLACPNPAHQQVTLRWNVESAGGLRRVEILDARGRLIRLCAAAITPGNGHGAERSVPWDLRDELGRRVPAGTYFARDLDRENAPGVRIVVLR